MHSLTDTLEALDSWYFDRFDEKYTNNVVEAVKKEYARLEVDAKCKALTKIVGEDVFEGIEGNSSYDRRHVLHSIGKTISKMYNSYEKTIHYFEEFNLSKENINMSEEEKREIDQYFSEWNEKFSGIEKFVSGVQHSTSLSKQNIERNLTTVYKTPQHFSANASFNEMMIHNITNHIEKAELTENEIKLIKKMKEVFQVIETVNATIHDYVFGDIYS